MNSTNWIDSACKEMALQDSKKTCLVRRAPHGFAKIQKIGLGRVIFENTGNIGKSYRKHDEIGTPVCITVDFQTLEDDSVTIRDRDSMEQKRLDIDNLNNYLINLINY